MTGEYIYSLNMSNDNEQLDNIYDEYRKWVPEASDIEWSRFIRVSDTGTIYESPFIDYYILKYFGIATYTRILYYYLDRTVELNIHCLTPDDFVKICILMG